MSLRRALAVAGLAIGPGLVGCGGAPPADAVAVNANDQAIASMHVSKCGCCHTLPAPQTRTRDHLEDAFARHKRRVHLTPDEWAAMVDYLAMPGGVTARQP